jgi:hypothetical protein
MKTRIIDRPHIVCTDWIGDIEPKVFSYDDIEPTIYDESDVRCVYEHVDIGLIEEINKYQLRLARQSSNGSYVRFQLFEVILPNDESCFVLADTPNAAVSQATCGLELSVPDNRCEVRMHEFRIRGWGTSTF